MKKITFKFGFAFALAAFALSAQAEELALETSATELEIKASGKGTFAADAMVKASGFAGGTIDGWTMSVADGAALKFVDTLSSPDTLNRQERGWYAGATIFWPTYKAWSKTWAYATDGRAQMQTSRMSQVVTGEEPGSGNGLTVWVDDGDMMATTWWAWITPEEAFAANGGTFQQKIRMRADKVGTVDSHIGVNDADFYINFDTSTLKLTDPNTGILWFPAVATNAAGKVYGDLNEALKAGGTIVSVADAAITNAVTLEDGIVYYKSGKNISGLDKLTLIGGSYDFNPTGLCTIGDGYAVQKSDNFYKVVPAVVKIGSVGFLSLVDAFKAVKKGETIEVLKDCSGAGIVVNPNTITDVTVDLGGFTYTCTSPAGYKYPDKGLDIREGNTLTFKNGTFTSVKDSGVIVFAEIYAKVTFDGVTIDGRLVDHFVEFKEGDYVLTNNSGTTILTNSTVIAKDGDFAIDTCKLDGYVPATVVLDYGSSVTGKIAISGGNLTVNKGVTIDGSLVIVDGLGAGVVTKHKTVELAAPAECAWNDIANDMQQLVLAVAKIDTVYYPTLDKAIADAKTNDTVTVLRSCKSDGEPIDLPITLDSNEQAITNLTLGAHAVLTLSNINISPNKLRAEYPKAFGTIAGGAKVITDKTYVYHAKLDTFIYEGTVAVATTADGGLVSPEGYTTFNEAFADVTTNGTLYVLKDLATDGFTVKYDMTIDLVKAADDEKGYTLTLTNCDTKTTALYVAKETKGVTIKGGAIKAEGTSIRTLVESFSQFLTLDGVTLDGSAMVNANATKSIYALSLGNGSTVLTNTVLNLPRAAKAYALYVGCSGAATQNLVTFQGANKITGNIVINAQNVVPVEVAFADIVFDADYTFLVNAYNAETKITKSTASELKVDDPFSWSSNEGLDTLVFGKCLNLTTGKYFSTLAAAFGAPAKSGETIRLCADVEEAEDVHVANGVTLDLCGHTLTAYLDVNGVPFAILGTNDYSRIVGEVWATNGANLSICGGTYGLVAAYGKNTINIADAILKCDNENETALQIGSYGEYDPSYDENLTVTIRNSRITGYSAAYIGGGKLTISNSVLTAFGSEKMSIDRTNWTGGTGDALVIDQVPGCPISVTLEAGTKLQHNLDIGTEQLGWCMNAQGTVTATVKKRDGVDALAVDGYYWAGDVGGLLTMTKDPVPPSPTIPVPMMIAKNTLNLASAFRSSGLDPDGEVNVGGESIPVRPSDITIATGADGVTVSVKSIPDLTYELVAYENLVGEGKVVESVVAKDTATTFTQQPSGAACFYRVRVRR